MSDQSKLEFGKYRGHTFAEVYHRCPSYVDWVLSQQKTSPLSKKPFAVFQQYVRRIELPWSYWKLDTLWQTLRGIIKGGDKNIHRSIVIRAMRSEIQDQIDAFHKVTGTVGDRSVHVDHNYEEDGKMFRDISSSFLVRMDTSVEELRLKLDHLPGKSYKCNLFVDRVLADEWKEFHRNRASLRIIPKEQNLRARASASHCV